MLSDELLKEVQKYAEGEVLYFPKLKQRNWGDTTGAKGFYVQRNEEIKRKYGEKQSIESNSDEYGLSLDTAKKLFMTELGT